MGVFGVKILDSDTALDVYEDILEAFDGGAELAAIEAEYPLAPPEDYDDEVDAEMYTTACGLAYYELGLMTPERLAYIKTVLDKQASVQAFLEEDDATDSKARQRVLDRYWAKISQPNTKVRKRKKYKKILNFHFKEDEVLVFKLNENYCAVICIDILQHKGSTSYSFVPTTYKSINKPTIADIQEEAVYGLIVKSGWTREQCLMAQPTVATIWEYLNVDYPSNYGNVVSSFTHKELSGFLHQFESLGKIPFKADVRNISGMQGGNDFEGFCAGFKRATREEPIGNWKPYNKIPIRLLRA